MRIGIDVRTFSRPKAGVARVLQCLLNGLLEIDLRNTYFLYSDRDFIPPLADARWQKRVYSRLRLLPGTFWLCTDLKRMIEKDRLDLFWGPEHVLPPGLPASMIRVVTIHDVVWKKYPETMGRFNRLTKRLLVDRSIKEASLLIAVSNSTAFEARRLLDIPESRIRVIYNGVSQIFRPHPHGASAHYISQKYNVSHEYILALGTIEPRKNLQTLIDAAKILREKLGFSHQLVIAGSKGWKSSPIYGNLKRAGLTHGEVVFSGYIEEEDLPKAYSGAKVFVMPSLYEGFGLPLLEAMACGAPVVCSDASALVEVGGDAVVSVPARRADSFAEAISRVCKDDILRVSMVEKGCQRAQQFSWERSAKQVLDVFEEAYAANSH
jgi:glycosyltransferase involved in cell wall biosynthesis